MVVTIIILIFAVKLRRQTPVFTEKSGIEFPIFTNKDMIERLLKVTDAQEGSVFLFVALFRL